MNYILDDISVHVWKGDLDLSTDLVAKLYRLLSKEECEKANKFYRVKDRNRFIIGRGTLRNILSAYLSLSPSELQFSYNKYGKPSILTSQNQNNLSFNLSHSNDRALFAITRSRRIGVDIEYIREDFASLDIAERFFSKSEVEVLKSLPVEQRVNAFFNCWSRKEAYIKAIGMGVSFPLDKFTVSLQPDVEPALLKVDANENEAVQWKMYKLNIGEHYAAALIVENLPVDLSSFEWTTT